MSDTCVYTQISMNGYGTDWQSQCGHRLRIASPMEVGWSIAPLPNADGKFCSYCGREIEIRKESEMNKCREAYELFFGVKWEEEHPHCKGWQAAWNAAIARATEICYHEAGVYTKEDAARAIEREQEK